MGSSDFGYGRAFTEVIYLVFLGGEFILSGSSGVGRFFRFFGAIVI